MQKIFIRILFLSGLFCSNIWTMSINQIGNALDLARNIFLTPSSKQPAGTAVTPGASQQAAAPVAPSTVAPTTSSQTATAPTTSGQAATTAQGQTTGTASTPSGAQNTASTSSAIPSLGSSISVFKYPYQFLGPNDNRQQSQLWLGAKINGTNYRIVDVQAIPSGWIALPNLQNALINLSVAQWTKGVYLTLVQNNNAIYLAALDSNSNLIASDVLQNVTSVTGNVTWSGSYISVPPSLPASQAFGLTMGTDANISSSITVASLAQSSSTTTQAVSKPIEYDLKNHPLTELSIMIYGSKLTFVLDSESMGQCLIPNLPQLPVGTDQFTIAIHGYTGSSTFNTFSDLQTAITSNPQAVKFAVYVYDKNNQPIGTGVDIPPALVSVLTTAFSSATMPNVSLSVNSESISQGPVTYPISLTLQNVGNENMQNWGNPIYDLRNEELSQLSISVDTTDIIFMQRATASTSKIANLNFIPSGTASFILEIYGYTTSQSPLVTLSDLQTAISNKTLQGFAAQVYDANNTPIGSSIVLSPDQVTALTSSFSSNSFTSKVFVNDNLRFKTYSYPIYVTLENISGWTSEQQTPSQAVSQNTQPASSGTGSTNTSFSTIAGIATLGSSIPVSPYPNKFLGPNTSGLWLGVTINGTSYLIVDPAVTNPQNLPTGWTLLFPNLQAALSALSSNQWAQGVYLALVQSDNSIYVVAVDSSNNLIASDILQNVTSVTGNVLWQGSYIVNGVSLTPSQAFGLTTGTVSNLSQSITVKSLQQSTSSSAITTSTVTKIDVTGLTPSASIWSGFTNAQQSLTFTFTDNTAQTVSFNPLQNNIIFSVSNNPKVVTNDPVINITSTSQVKIVSNGSGAILNPTYWAGQIIPALNKLISSLQPGQYIVANIDSKTNNLNLYVLSSNT